MKFYIATGFENIARHHEVRDALTEDGHEITFDWTKYTGTDGTKLAPEERHRISEEELGGVRNAQVVVVILPGGRGTHIELGAALALQKPVYLLQDPENPIDKDPIPCLFYWHEDIETSTSLEHLRDCIRGFDKFTKVAAFTKTIDCMEEA